MNERKTSDSLLSDHLKGVNGNPSVMTVSLLVSTLVEELCCLYEHDEHRREILFRVVCDQLVEMALLSPLAYLDELAAIRARYRETFMQILKIGQGIASEQAGKLKAMGIPLSKSPGNGFAVRNVTSAMNVHPHDHFVLMPSRYQEEFEELNLIGQGGFGRVFQARNRVDGQEYAVKKIRLPKKSSRENILKIFREVKVLAGLHHKHVVGYNAAWLELEVENASDSRHEFMTPIGSDFETSAAHAQLDSPQGGKFDGFLRNPFPISAAIAMELQKHKDSREDSQDDNGILFSRIESDPDISLAQTALVPALPDILPGRLGSPVLKIKNNSGDGFKRTLKRAGDSGEFAAIQSQFPSLKFQTATLSQTPVVLFIQMELCGKTLREWLEERNTAPPVFRLEANAGEGASGKDRMLVVDVIECNKILKHVLKGIDYIHSKGLIHRDLKPRNIFFHMHDNRVMIGDFGLARKDLLTSNEDALFSPNINHRRMSAGVGTVTYASPEQLHGSAYDTKSDMFSLGIVMFEMLSAFATEMERSICLSTIRSGRFQPEFVAHYPAHAAVIQSLLKTNARLRPEAREILASDLFVNRDLIIQNLSKEIVTLQAALAEKNFPGQSE